MRGTDERSGWLFSYVDLEIRVPKDHPLRAIRDIANEALCELSAAFAALYAPLGRPSIPPEKLLRALLLQAFYSIRSERQLMERLEFDLLFRWFVGLGVDDPAWGHIPAPNRRRGRLRSAQAQFPVWSERRSRLERRLSGVVRDRSPSLPADRADGRSAGSPRHWPATASPRPGNCLVCPIDRNIAAQPRPNARPSWERRCRQRSRL